MTDNTENAITQEGDFEKGAIHFEGSIEDIFSDELPGDDVGLTEEAAAAEPTEDKQESMKTTEEAKKPTDEKGDEETAPPADAEKSDSDKTVPLGALEAERKKRQELEKQIEKLQKDIAGKEVDRGVEHNGESPDMYEDPEGYKKWLRNEIRAEVKTTTFEQRVKITQDEFKKTHPDYDEKVEVFKKLTELNPSLADELVSVSNPAKFAYDTVVTYEENKRLSSPETLKSARAKIEAEIRAEIAAEARKASEKLTQQRNNAALDTPDILNIGSSGVSQGVDYSTNVEDYMPD